MDFEKIKPYIEKPVIFAPGEPLFWDDPHISAQMLNAHINLNNDQASRWLELIENTVKWLMDVMDLHPGTHLLDLGCGSGLNALRFAQSGLRVTGIDYLKRSIQYAQEAARESRLNTEYHYQDYLNLVDRDKYDAAILIYGDYCPLSPENRRLLLSYIRQALKPGGVFAFDVTTPLHRKKHGVHNGWYLVESGFWKPGTPLVLEEGFDYPEQSIYLDQAIVIDADETISVYRNQFQDFSLETITRELSAGGFTIIAAGNDLTGTPYTEDTEWIGLVTKVRKP